MGSWGSYEYPTEPSEPPDWQIFEKIADMESLEAFVEREISYADSKADTV